MPIEHRVDVNANLLRVRRWGAVSTQDEEQAFASRKSDPLIVPGIPVLVDSTGVEPPDSPEVVKYIADCTTRIAADLRCGPLAIVVATDVQFGMARMYQAFTDLAHPRTCVFRSEPEALAWLGSHRVAGVGTDGLTSA